MEETLSGKRILVVEDDYFTASELSARLTALAVDVVGPAPDLEGALELIEGTTNLQGAILDINLGGRMVFPVADALQRLAIPFIFATGYERDIVPAEHADKIVLRKPVDDRAVVASLLRATIMESVARQDLAGNAILAKLSADEADSILPHLRKVYLPQGMIMEMQGDPITRIIFPLSCVASMVVVGHNGTRIETGLIGNEGLTGVGLAEGDARSTHELVNQVEGFALTMSATRFNEVLAEVPRLQMLTRRFARVMSIQASYTAFANGRFSISQRLARSLVMIQDRTAQQREFRLTHEYLSIMLGVRRPSVTAAMHILEGERWIKATRSHIRIIDRKGLVEFAGEAYGAPEKEYERLMECGHGQSVRPTPQLEVVPNEHPASSAQLT